MIIFLLLFVSGCGMAKVRAETQEHHKSRLVDKAVDTLLRELQDVKLDEKQKASKRTGSQPVLAKKMSHNIDSEINKIVKSLFSDNTEHEARQEGEVEVGRRNALQLAQMVQHTTGTNPTRYLSYGCYCGFAGQGEPVDALDRCCRTHDRCYGQLTADYGCSEWWRYFNTYNWELGPSGNIICLSDSDECKEGQCACDKQMAECFQEHHTVYNDDYTGWWWTLFKEC